MSTQCCQAYHLSVLEENKPCAGSRRLWQTALIETFSEQELSEKTFIATAVGQVHKDKGDDHRPRHVGHYWPDYDPEMAKTNPNPQTFMQYVVIGMGQAETTGQSYPAVEKIAQGILRLAGMAECGKTFHERRHCHRYVLQLLDGCANSRKLYGKVLDRFAVRREVPTKDMWNDDRRRVVRKIAETIAQGSLTSPEVKAFLGWPDDLNCFNVAHSREGSSTKQSTNIPVKLQRLIFHVGSIHSVKERRHTPQLWCWKEPWQGRNGTHNLELLLPWLRRKKVGGSNVGPQQQSRLKLHYVAMTRPTHLLCLAMKRNTFMKEDGSIDQELVQELKNSGWEIKIV